jgi:hypothetical protein
MASCPRALGRKNITPAVALLSLKDIVGQNAPFFANPVVILARRAIHPSMMAALSLYSWFVAHTNLFFLVAAAVILIHTPA